MDWRERRDELVAEYLERTGGDPRAAYDALGASLDALEPPIDAEVVFAHLEARDALFGLRMDPTGTLLTPSPGGEECLGNGRHEDVECCCDECDYFLDCFDT